MIRDDLAALISSAAESVGCDVRRPIHLEQPANRDHGDWSTNTALASAKAAGRNPRELAQAMADWINANRPDWVVSAEVAGPGFLNFRLSADWLVDVLSTVIDRGVDDYAKLDLGRGEKVLVEFVSPNPTGPLHAGHARNAFYGDALARLLVRSGYDVERECYLNDRGTQMQRYGESLAARAAGNDVGEDGYKGEYIIDWAKEMPADADPLEWGYARALADQREVLDSVGITFDTWFSERSLVESGATDDTLAELRAAGAVYEKDGATWLRSTDGEDDKDRVLIKGNGELAYFLPDVAYHRDKLRRGFDTLIDVWGADHHGYIPRMKAAIAALGYDPDRLQIEVTQLVKLMRGGAEVKLSKRAGQLLEMREVIDEIGPDAARLTYLLQSIDTPQTVDLDVVTAQSMDNPVYYVQMAHTRMASLGRVAAERGVVRQPIDEVNLQLLTHDRETEVLRALFDLPDVIALATTGAAPHRVTNWLRSTAGAVHGWYHDCPVLAPSTPPDVQQARLWLAEGARIGLRVGLDVLGVSAPDQM